MSHDISQCCFLLVLALALAGCQSAGTPPPESAEGTGAAAEPATEPPEAEEPGEPPAEPTDTVGAPPQSSEALAVGMAQSGQTLELSVGQELTVTLDANATTGYSWTVDQIDESVLSQQGDPEYVVNNPDPNLVGGGGRAIFRFQAASPGQSELRLIYHRQWEQGVAPVQTFTATVVVR